MTSCDYCQAAATTQIPMTPGRACQMHAQEFWTDLLRYNRNTSRPQEHHETPCVSRVDGLTRLKLDRVAARAAVLTIKGGDVSIRRAS